MKLLYETELENEELIGRLAIGLHTFVGGHIYYGNTCLRIRYDLIENPNNSRFGEDDIIDIYNNIFDMSSMQRFTSNSPLESIQSHKLAYMIKDMSFETCTKLEIYPYLHERQVYLNRIKSNTNYFYNAMETPVQDVVKHNEFICEKYSDEIKFHNL